MDSLMPVELHDGDLVLRPLQPGDVESIYEACQDDEIQRWTQIPSPYARKDAEEFVAGDVARWEAGTPTFAVVDVATGRLVGCVGCVGGGGGVDAAGDGDIEIGYWVTPGSRRRGVARRALRLVTEWLFANGCPRIVWHAQVGNVASRRVAESVGFVVEGRVRKVAVHRGQRVDLWIGSLLPSDVVRQRTQRESHLEGWPTEPIELRSERLLLRPTRESDAPALLEYAQDPVASIWDPEETPDLEAAVERARWRADWSSGDIAVWTIADLDDTSVLGGIQVFDVSRNSLHATTGYGLMPAARGRGYAREALRTVADWAFRETTLNRIQLMHAIENEGSCAVATASGFALEGLTRQSYRFGDGLLHDEHLHARLRDDPAP